MVQCAPVLPTTWVIPSPTAIHSTEADTWNYENFKVPNNKKKLKDVPENFLICHLERESYCRLRLYASEKLIFYSIEK